MARTKNLTRIVITVLAVLLCVVLVPLLVFNLLIVLTSVIHPDVVPSVFGFIPMVETSDEAAGEFNNIKKNDFILVSSKNVADLGEGAIIAVQDDFGSILFRKVVSVSDVNGSTVYSVTAENSEALELVNEQNVLGGFVGRVAALGGIIMFAHTPLGIVLFIGLPALGFVLYDVLSKRKKPASVKADKAAGATAAEASTELATTVSEVAEDLSGEVVVYELDGQTATFRVESSQNDGDTSIACSEVVTKYDKPLRYANTTVRVAKNEK